MTRWRLIQKLDSVCIETKSNKIFIGRLDLANHGQDSSSTKLKDKIDKTDETNEDVAKVGSSKRNRSEDSSLYAVEDIFHPYRKAPACRN